LKDHRILEIFLSACLTQTEGNTRAKTENFKMHLPNPPSFG
jgi:Mn-dependent DtxR family transcriptional regulator